MNIIQQTLQREYGFNSSTDYDWAIKYINCLARDNFHNDDVDDLRDSPMIACRFCKSPNYENYLALANEDGLITIQNTSHNPSLGQSTVFKKVQGHQNVIFDLAWSPGNLQLVSVSGDHTAILWDVGAKGESIIPIHRFQGHMQSVKTVSFSPEEKSVFATGSRDGKIMVWDYRLEHSEAFAIAPDNTISFCHFPTSNFRTSHSKQMKEQRPDSITSVLFKDSFSIISSSAGDRAIKVWDIRKCYSVYKRVPKPCFEMFPPEDSKKNGFSNLVMNSSRVRLYANCMDDTIYCYNVAAYLEKPVAMYKGHKNYTYYIKSCLSSDDKYLMSGSSDRGAYIWNVNKPEKPVAKLVGHSAEVTSVDWCSKGEIKLVTCSDDFCYRIWRLRPDIEAESVERPLDVRGWATLTSSTKKTYRNVFIPQTTPTVFIVGLDKQAHIPDLGIETTTDGRKTVKIEGSMQSVLSILRSNSKGARRLFDVDSTCGNPNSEIEVLSPTSNLPNYIIDGTSPHHRCTVSRQKENQNWLEKLQVTPPPPNNSPVTRKRKLRQTTPPPPNNSPVTRKRKLRQTTPPPPNNSPVTRKRKLKQTTPKTSKHQSGNLLTFFFRGATKQTLTKPCEIQREPLLTEANTTETLTS